MKKMEYKRLANDIYLMLEAQENLRIKKLCLLKARVVNDLRMVGIDASLEDAPKREDAKDWKEIAKNISYLLVDMTFKNKEALKEHTQALVTRLNKLGFNTDNLSLYPVFMEIVYGVELNKLDGASLYETAQEAYKSLKEKQVEERQKHETMQAIEDLAKAIA